MKHRELRRLLNSIGYKEDTGRGKGGHIVFKKEGAPGIVTVPISSSHSDIAPGTLRDIFKKAGIRIDRDNGTLIEQEPERWLHLAPGS